LSPMGVGAAVIDRDRALSIPFAKSRSKMPTHPLLLPANRPVSQHRRKPQPFRLPAVEDCLDQVRREAGAPEEPGTYASVTPTCSARSVIDLP
jgi:hypothetical protein